MNKEIRGALCTMAGGCLWGLSGSCGQYLFTNYEVSSSWLTAVRMLTAGVLLMIYLLATQRKQTLSVWKCRADAGRLILFAVFGLMCSQFTYLTAISYSNAATATVLQYTGPVFILLFVCITKRRLPNRRESAAIVLAVTGTFLLATHGNVTTMVLSEEGLFWGMLAAVSLMSYTLLPVRLIPKWGSRIVTGYGMLIGGCILSVLVRLWEIPVSLDWKGWLAVGGVAILGTLVAYTLYLQGISDIGPVRGSLLSSVEPVSATLCSVFWLHTKFEPIDFLGFFCILITVVLLARKEETPGDGRNIRGNHGKAVRA